jgi:hypothetical protein
MGVAQHARTSVEPVTDVVPIEHAAVVPQGVKTMVEGVGDGALARATQPGEPDDAAAMAVKGLAPLAGDLVFVPGDVGVVGHGEIVPEVCIKPIILA